MEMKNLNTGGRYFVADGHKIIPLAVKEQAHLGI